MGMYINTKFIVGTLPRTINSIMGTEKTEPLFTALCLPTFYHDTRGENGHGDSSDIFTSSVNPNDATRYNTAEEAENWNKEFLDDEGVIYRVN